MKVFFILDNVFGSNIDFIDPLVKIGYNNENIVYTTNIEDVLENISKISGDVCVISGAMIDNDTYGGVRLMFSVKEVRPDCKLFFYCPKRIFHFISKRFTAISPDGFIPKSGRFCGKNLIREILLRLSKDEVKSINAQKIVKKQVKKFRKRWSWANYLHSVKGIGCWNYVIEQC